MPAAGVTKCPECGEWSTAVERIDAAARSATRTAAGASEQPPQPGEPVGGEAMTTRREQEEIDRGAVVDLARKDPKVHQGELEIDDDAAVSYGGENGAYVQAWLWVGFEGTPLDEEAEGEGEPLPGGPPGSP
jgi:hypothetical protein